MGCASQNGPYVMIIVYDKKNPKANKKPNKQPTTKKTTKKPCKFFQEVEEAVQGSRGAII